MPYKHIIWVKLFLDLLDGEDSEKFLWELSEMQQLVYVKLLLIAGRTKNKISKTMSYLKEKMRFSGSESDLKSDINQIKKTFRQGFKETKYFYYFTNFEKLHNRVNGGTPKDDPGIPLEENRKEENRKEENKSKKPKDVYGEFVLLEEKEYEKLIKYMGKSNTDYILEEINLAIGKNPKCKTARENHYYTAMAWYRRKVRSGEIVKFNPKKYEEAVKIREMQDKQEKKIEEERSTKVDPKGAKVLEGWGIKPPKEFLDKTTEGE